MINECQKYAKSNTKITEDIINVVDVSNFSSLVEAIKTKKFNSIREWVGINLTSNSQEFYKSFYDNLSKFVENSSVPMIVLTLAEYMYRDNIVVDKEVNLVACLTDIMLNNEIKYK